MALQMRLAARRKLSFAGGHTADGTSEGEHGLRLLKEGMGGGAPTRKAPNDVGDFVGQFGYKLGMEPENARTLIDYWPVFVLVALAIVAIIGVTRGLKRPGDGSKNKSGGGGSDFMGRGGRW